MDFHRQSLSERLSALLASVSGQRQPVAAASTPVRLPEKKRELTAGEIETLPQVLDFIKATSNPKKIRDVVARFLQNPLLSDNDRELVKKKVLEKIEEEKRKKEAKKASTEPNTTLSSSSSSATTVCEPPKVEKNSTSEHGRAQQARPAHEAPQRGSASRAEPPPEASYGPQGKAVSQATSGRQSGTPSQASAGQSKQQASQAGSGSRGKTAQTGAAQNAGASSQASAAQQAKSSPQTKQEKATSQGKQAAQQKAPSQGEQTSQEKASSQSGSKSPASESAQQGCSSKEAANSSKETLENRAPSDGDKPAAQESKTEENNEAYLEQLHYVGDLVAKLRRLSEPVKVCSVFSSEAPIMKEEAPDPAAYNEWVTSTPVTSSIPATTPCNMMQYSTPIGQSFQPCPGMMFPMQSSLFQVPPPNFDFRTATPAANHSYAGFRPNPPLLTALPLASKLTERDRIPRTPTPPSRSPEPRIRPGAIVAVLNESGRLVMPGARVVERTRKEQEAVPEKDPLKEQEKPPEKNEQPTDVQMEEAARSKDCYTWNYALRHGVSLEEAERMIAREEWELRNEREREQWELRNRGEHEHEQPTDVQREEAARAKDCYTRNYALRHGVSLEEAERMIAREEWELQNEREQYELRNHEARRAPKRRNEFESSREYDRYMKGFEPLPPNQKYAKNVDDEEYDPYHPAYLPVPPPPPGYDYDFWRSRRRAGYEPEEGEILNSSFDSTGTGSYYDPRNRYYDADHYSSYPGDPARERPPGRRSLLDGL